MAAGSFLFVVRALAGAAAFAWAECAVIVEAFRRPCNRLRGFVCALCGVQYQTGDLLPARRGRALGFVPVVVPGGLDRCFDGCPSS